MTIPLLEFIAVLINIVVFGRLVFCGFHDTAFIVMHIDASASVTVLASGAPKSQPAYAISLGGYLGQTGISKAEKEIGRSTHLRSCEPYGGCSQQRRAWRYQQNLGSYAFGGGLT